MPISMIKVKHSWVTWEVLQAKGVVLWLQENKITNKYNIISRKASQNMSIEQVTSA